MRETVLHQNLLKYIQNVVPQNFLFMLCNAGMTENKSTHTFDHAYHRYLYNSFTKVPVTILNLGHSPCSIQEDWLRYSRAGQCHVSFHRNAVCIAEPIRMLLEFVGEEYEDKRYLLGDGPGYNAEEWTSVKYTLGLDFPNVPYYIDGDIKLTQTNAILRHLGRKYNLLGKTESEMRRVDLMLEQTMDFRNGVITLCYYDNYERLQGDYFKALPDNLKVFETFLGDNKWFAGNSITIADFHIYEMCDQHKIMKADSLKSFPKLLEFCERFEAESKIKAYMNSNKFMKGGPLNNKNAKW